MSETVTKCAVCGETANHIIHRISQHGFVPEQPLRTYPATAECPTTGTRRFETRCDCPTYPENCGVCATFELGQNGHCAYCDHTRRCHETRVCQPTALPQPDSSARKAAVRIASGRFACGPKDSLTTVVERIITDAYAAQTAELEELRKRRDMDRRMLYIANDRAIEIDRLRKENDRLLYIVEIRQLVDGLSKRRIGNTDLRATRDTIRVIGELLGIGE